MTTSDANSPDGIVPIGRQFNFIGDIETEQIILNNRKVFADARSGMYINSRVPVSILCHHARNQRYPKQVQFVCKTVYSDGEKSRVCEYNLARRCHN